MAGLGLGSHNKRSSKFGNSEPERCPPYPLRDTYPGHYIPALASLNIACDLQLARIQHALNRVQPRLVPVALNAPPPKRRRVSSSPAIRRQFGLCLECPAPAREGFAYCYTCAERRRFNQQRRRDEARRLRYGPPRTMRRFRVMA